MKPTSSASTTASHRAEAPIMRCVLCIMALMTRKALWVLDADICGFCDSVTHGSYCVCFRTASPTHAFFGF